MGPTRRRTIGDNAGAAKPTPEQVAYAETVLKKPEDAKPYHGREKNYAHRAATA